MTVDGTRYTSRTRLVITPHFSYNAFFLPQFRLPPAAWQTFLQTEPACVASLTVANGFTVEKPSAQYPNGYIAIQLPADRASAGAARAWLARQFPGAARTLDAFYVDPHPRMAGVLEDMYRSNALIWKQNAAGGFLARTEGSCRFCVNRHWQFPNECRYDKTQESPPPVGFLEKVAQRIVETGRPAVSPEPIASSAVPLTSMGPLP